MSWIDIVIIAMVVVGGVIGVFRGVKRSLVSLVAFAVSFGLAFFLAGVVAEALLGVNGIKNFVLGNGFGADAETSLANILYAKMIKGDWFVTDSYIAKNFYAPIDKIIASASVAVPVENATEAGRALYMSFLVLSAVSAIGIFAVSRLLLVIVTTIVNSFVDPREERDAKGKTRKRKRSGLERVLGLFTGMIRGAAWAFTVTFVFSCVGGMVFFDAFKKVEDEYEHKNAVLCGYVNDAAYGMRNSMFLPDSDLYGRLVESVFKPDPDYSDTEPLEPARLEAFIALNNLNYPEGQEAWSISPTKKRVEDESKRDGAYKPADYAEIGFEGTLSAVMLYNSEAAVKLDIIDGADNFEDKTVPDHQMLLSFINDGSNSMQASVRAFVSALEQYKQAYRDGKKLTDAAAIDQYNSTTIPDKYNTVTAALVKLRTDYSRAESWFGALELPETPAVKPVGGADDPDDPPVGPVDPPEGEIAVGGEAGGEGVKYYKYDGATKLDDYMLFVDGKVTVASVAEGETEPATQEGTYSQKGETVTVTVGEEGAETEITVTVVSEGVLTDAAGNYYCADGKTPPDGPDDPPVGPVDPPEGPVVDPDDPTKDDEVTE